MNNAIALEDLRDLYQDMILDHGRKPRHFRILPEATHSAVGNNPLCGDRLHLYLKISKEGTIEAAAFQGTGCAIATAAASIMTDVLHGKTNAQAKDLFRYFHALSTSDNADASSIDEESAARLQALSGVRQYPVRVKCATLAWHALDQALKGEAIPASTE